MTTTIIAYTDGACKGNGKENAAAGGWGAHICYPNGDIQNIWGHEADTTNNRMELMAAIGALERTPADTPLQLWTDSSYVKNGITSWIHAWRAKNWRKADGKPVLNLELWQKLDALAQNRSIDWQWVKGHAGHAGNEMADALANRGVTGGGEEFIAAQPKQNLNFPEAADTFWQPNDKNKTSTNEINTNSETDSEMHSEFEPTIDNEPPQITIPPTQHGFAIAPPPSIEQNPAYDGDTSRVNPDFWALLPKPINRGHAERQLIMDTETTGFNDQGGDRIVEVGIIEMVERQFTGNRLHVYINPDKQMDDEVIRVHGITNEFVSDKPKFADVAQAIYDFMVDSEVIAHNAQFDMRFLKMEFDKVGLTDFLDRVQVTDSLALARQLYAGQKATLDALAKRLGVNQRDRTFHGALLDSEILADVYLKMTGGQISLAIDDESGNADGGSDGGGQFLDLSAYAAQLQPSVADAAGDSAWRAAVLKS